MKTNLNKYHSDWPSSSSSAPAPAPAPSESKQACTISDLPDDVLHDIMLRVGFREAHNLSKVNKHLFYKVGNRREFRVLAELTNWTDKPSWKRSDMTKRPNWNEILEFPKFLRFSPREIEGLEKILASDNLEAGELQLAYWVSELSIDEERKKTLMRNIRAEWVPKCWPILEKLNIDVSGLKDIHRMLIAECPMAQAQMPWSQSEMNRHASFSVMGRSPLAYRSMYDSPHYLKNPIVSIPDYRYNVLARFARGCTYRRI